MALVGSLALTPVSSSKRELGYCKGMRQQGCSSGQFVCVSNGLITKTNISSSQTIPKLLPIYSIDFFSGSQMRFLGNSLIQNTKQMAAHNEKYSLTTLCSIKPPYNVVITGSTKGVGLELAREFLRSGDKVVICSRSKERVEKTLKELNSEYSDRVVGIPCDVSNASDVEKLTNFASQKLGSVDIWVNNAGSNAYKFSTLAESDDKSIIEIVQTNTLGVMLCCKKAINLLRNQPNGGHIFNMDGAGADGNATPRFAAYGATKRSLAQFTKSLQAELRMLNVKNVIVHNLSPGMVTTELLMAGGNTKTAKFFINALAEPPTEVAQFLVPRIRDVPISSGNKSTYIKFLTKPKAYSQIFARLLWKTRKDKYLLED